MAVQAISGVVIPGQDLGTGTGENLDPNSGASMPLHGAATDVEPHVVANYAEGLGFVSRDGNNDTITVGTGLCYIRDDATISPTASDGQTYRDGRPHLQPEKVGAKPWDYSHELAGQPVYPVEVRTQTTVAVDAGVQNTIWINIPDLTENNTVEIRSDGGGGTTTEPSNTSLKLGTINPDDSDGSEDTRPNDHRSPTLRALDLLGPVRESVTTGTVSGTVSLDLSASTVFRHTLGGDTTFQFTNPGTDPAGNSFTLVVEQDGTGGHAITWPSSVEWPAGAAPSLSTGAGDKHMLAFVSPDGGTTWLGVPSGEGFA